MYYRFPFPAPVPPITVRFKRNAQRDCAIAPATEANPLVTREVSGYIGFPVFLFIVFIAVNKVDVLGPVAGNDFRLIVIGTKKTVCWCDSNKFLLSRK